MANVTRGDVLYHSTPFYVALNGDVTRGDPIGQDGTNWVRADADAVISCMGFALASGASGDVIPACTECIQQTTTDLTVGNMLWLSATAGRIDDASVGAAATMTQVIGWVVRGATTETMYLCATIPHVEATGVAHEASLVASADFAAFFVADRQYRVLGARERHSVAGSDGGAVTLTVVKMTSGTAKASGVNILTTTFSLKSTADTPVWLGPSTTVADTRIVPGDALGMLSTGTLTAVIDTSVTVELVVAER